MIKNKYDLNRNKKVYPLIRSKPKFKFFNNNIVEGVNVETALLEFNDSFEETYFFSKSYTEIPIIAATPESDNVNIFIVSLSTTQVKIQSSEKFVGKVHIQVFESGL